MIALRATLLSAFALVTFAQNADARRTCRVVFPERPRDAPRSGFIFDGKTSHAVSLPSMNLSEVIELPEGNLAIALTPRQVTDPAGLATSTPILKIPEELRDFYIIISPDAKNQDFPVKMNLVESGDGKLKPGQTLWFNMTGHRIVAKMGEKVFTVEPKGRKISDGPISQNGYYLAQIAYHANGDGPLAPITEQKWWHDTKSRQLGFIVSTGGKLPKLYCYSDVRTSEAVRKAIAEADPTDLKPVIEPLAQRPTRVPEELAPEQDEPAIDPGQ